MLCFLGKHQQDWDKFLPDLGMSIRSMVKRNTGFTPNFLQLGREINLPMDVMLGLPVNKETSYTVTDYTKQLIDQLNTTYGEVQQNLNGAQKQLKTFYDRRVYPKMFNVRDLVYRRDSSVRKCQSCKLFPLCTGPYIVTEVLSPYLYRDQDRRRVLVLHHDRMKLCDDSHPVLGTAQETCSAADGARWPFTSSWCAAGTCRWCTECRNWSTAVSGCSGWHRQRCFENRWVWVSCNPGGSRGAQHRSWWVWGDGGGDHFSVIQEGRQQMW